MDDIRIVPTAERYAEAVRNTLDEVCREKLYLAFLQAPPLETVTQFIRTIRAGGGVQCLAVTSHDQVVGWCDVIRRGRETEHHVGTLGIGLLAPFRGKGVGRRLAEEAIKDAWKAGIERI